MIDPLALFGAVTGGVGMITGAIGSILAVKAYRRAAKDKALDLRVQLHKEVRELTLECRALPAAIALGVRSRQAVMAATGRTGALDVFMKESEVDSKRSAEMPQQLVGIGDLSEPDDVTALERRLVEVHGLRVELSQLKSKYRSAMDQDDAARDRIARAAIGRRPPG